MILKKYFHALTLHPSRLLWLIGVNDMKNKKVSNQQEIVIFETKGFIFYIGDDNKVKTLIFNER